MALPSPACPNCGADHLAHHALLELGFSADQARRMVVTAELVPKCEPVPRPTADQAVRTTVSLYEAQMMSLHLGMIQANAVYDAQRSQTLGGTKTFTRVGLPWGDEADDRRHRASGALVETCDCSGCIAYRARM